MQTRSRGGIIKSFISLLALCQSLTATAATVYVSYFGLSPNPVYIEAGEVVYWTDAEPDLGPYMISGGWGYYIFPPDGVQFTVTGTYSYTAASAYGGGGWSGTVHVAANSPPTVTITSPTNHSVFTAPATFAFEAETYDANPWGLMDVEFWVGSEMVEDVQYAPYATTVTNLAAGTYILKAVVRNNFNATATNSITITVVGSGPITLNVAALAAGKFKFNASGLTAGKTQVLQTSTNLASPLSWVPVSTNVAASSTASFTNTVTTGQHFFRLLQLP